MFNGVRGQPVSLQELSINVRSEQFLKLISAAEGKQIQDIGYISVEDCHFLVSKASKKH